MSGGGQGLRSAGSAADSVPATPPEQLVRPCPCGHNCVSSVAILQGNWGVRDVKQYVNLAPQIKDALVQFKEEVEKGSFPGPEHSFAMKEDEAEKI